MNRVLLFVSTLTEPILRVIGNLAELIRPGAGAELEKRLRGGIVSLGRHHLGICIDRSVFLNGVSRIELGERVKLHRGCQLIAGLHGSIKIGNGSHVGRNSIVSGHGSIVIGQECNISGLVALYTVSNQPDGSVKKASILIGNRVNIGANATILPGIVIGDGATIGAGAVVTKNVASNAIVAGVPARNLVTRTC